MYANKNVLVLGFARSGEAAARILVANGANVIVNDLNENQPKTKVQELEELGVRFVFGCHPENLLVDEQIDIIVKNPGVSLEHDYIMYANNHNISVTTEIEVAYNLMNDATIIAITGTNGKTTTSTLIYKMLKEVGKDVHLVGNIGNPISNYYDKYTSDTIFVVEVSAQQLYDIENFHANVAVLTNLSEAHLDFFLSKDLYFAMKKRVFNLATSSDIAVLNADDNLVLDLTFDIASDKKYFSTSQVISGGYLDDGYLVYEDLRIDVNDIKVVGKHNYQNILAAIIACKQFGITYESVVSVLSNFNGVNHRLEYVRSINKVRYYNDSKSTNIEACKTALNAFNEPIYLLLGGSERSQNFLELLPHMNYVNKVYTYGETSVRICDELNANKIDCHICVDIQDAIIKAHNDAQSNGVVLFSPACASWDQFNNFEERGDVFKLVVNSFKD